MKYRIKFTGGELEGEIFPIAGHALSIGRSRANEVQLGSPDVSGRHVILTLTANGVVLDNLSSRSTQIDGVPLIIGERKELFAGQEIKLGEEVKFVLEALPVEVDAVNTVLDDDQPTGLEAGPIPAPGPVSAQIQAAVPAPPPTENVGDHETIAMQTRMASPEELEFLKGSHQKQQTQKYGIYAAIGIALVGALILVYWLFVYRVPEKFVSWPVNAKGVEMSEVAKFEGCPWSKDIDIEYPAVPATVVTRSPGALEVDTRLGKYQDVPFRMMVEYFQNAGALREDRVRGFENWIAAKTQSSENWNFDAILPVGFYQGDHGIPYLCASYSRTVDNESFFGFAVFLRYEDWTFILLKEIPTRERWRAEGFIQAVCFFRFSPDFLLTHWEGMKIQRDTDAASNIAEAKSLLLRRSPSVWEKADYLLRSALVKSRSGKDGADEYKVARELLKTLRENQIAWFNAQKIAFFRARNRDQKRELEQVRENLKAVFSSDEDLRFHKIRQDKWD